MKLVSAVTNHKRNLNDEELDTPILTYTNNGGIVPLKDWENPEYFTAAFPTLFPYGVGGLLVLKDKPRFHYKPGENGRCLNIQEGKYSYILLNDQLLINLDLHSTILLYSYYKMSSVDVVQIWAISYLPRRDFGKKRMLK